MTEKNYEPKTLVYRQAGNQTWITLENGERVAQDISRKVLDAVAVVGAKLKNLERFTVVPKGLGQDAVMTVVRKPARVELTAVSTMPQSLSDYKKWLDHAVEHLSAADQYYNDLNLLRQGIIQAQVFDFCEVDEDRLKREMPRAVELHSKGFLDLPYETVVYRYTGKSRIHLLARRNAGVIQYNTDHGQTDHYVWPLTLMLCTKSVKLRTEQPSRKLQSKREERGKPPLPYVTYVDSEHYYQAMRNTETKGTHASPIAHLRRGHIRTLSDGRQIWIKDMLVNCKSLDEVADRERYNVKGEMKC